MKDLSIPITGLGENETAEIEVKVKGKSEVFEFRIETFPWYQTEMDKKKYGDLAKIHNLKKDIENYDKAWELIQIYTPGEKSKYIQVLYRKKTKPKTVHNFLIF